MDTMAHTLLCVSDLHFRRPFFQWLAAQAGKFDSIVIAGDMLDMHPNAATGLQRQAKWVLDWIAAFPRGRTRLFCVSGNHDFWPGDTSPAEARWLQRARRLGVHVDRDVVHYGGFTYACKPWAGPVHLPATAGPVVLISHGPPEHVAVASEQGHGVGDFETRLIAESLPMGSLVVSGHAHQPDNFFDRVGVGGAACFSPGCDLVASVPRHIVIDAGPRRARHFVRNQLVAAVSY